MSLNSVSWGSLGVRLFFVLSGFLITGILLRSRNLADTSGGGRLLATRQFYARRCLRIFPIYYLVIAIAAAINLLPVRELLGWLLTYTLNIQCTLQGWFPDNVSHFWSLAVEEQFYIIWPWLVLFTPRKWLVRLTVITIVVGTLFRVVVVASGTTWIAGYVLPFAALDALGLGSLLAISANLAFSTAALRVFFAKYALPAGLLGYGLLELLWQGGIESQEYYTALSDTMSALCFSWLVSSAARGFRGPVGAILKSKPILYCGKITYGIYVYHMFAPLILVKVFSLFGATYSAHGWLNFSFVTSATLITASLSWYLFEQPINSLKRYFSYKPVTASRRLIASDAGEVKFAAIAVGSSNRNEQLTAIPTVDLVGS
jgi:peptidoglycan/LPS O-acetylase OafA/YrhL